MTIHAVALLRLLGLFFGIFNTFANAEDAGGNYDHDLATAYIPTYLSSVVSRNQSEIFLLSSSSSSSNFVLRYLTISASFNASDAPMTIISRDLPFAKRERQKKDSLSFVYSETTNGSLIVYTGDCRNKSAEIWTFQPPSDLRNASDEGTWDRFVVHRSNDSTAALITGPATHSSMISFLPDQRNPSKIKYYVYGGLCTTDPGNEYWTPPPIFSNEVTLISSLGNNGDDKKGYKAVILPGHGGPVAEAGFTFTPLLPLRSHPSGSKSGAAAAYGQNFLAMGGYTQKPYSNERTFINMSTIAIFSLPEETWSYVDAHTNTESISKQFNRSDLQPRSGHSVVVSPDGSKIVLVGGWVVNTTIAAQPQVAILDIGANYGGSGLWTWRAAKDSGGFFKDGDGIYGHAATVLPGGSMIIAGGYGIRGKNKSKRHQLVDRSDAHDRVHIFDIDSESWVPNYHAPERPKPGELSNNKGGSGPLSTPGQRAAMALGIIVGVMLIGMGLLFCFLRQRRHSRRQANNGDRQLPASDMSETPRFEPPAVFAEYRERMRATPMSGGMRSYWSASVPLHHTSSSLDSDAYSYGSSDPLEVPDLGAGCGGLGIDSNLSMSLSRSSKDEHDEPSMSKSFLDSPPALVRGERAALGLQASEPLLARDIDAATKPYVDNDWKGKRKAAKDEVEGCQLPAIKGRFGYEWSRRPGKLGQYFYREGRKDGSSCESNERTMSDLSEMSGQSHSTAYTEPLFSSRLGGMVAALTSSSDPPFLQRALSRSKYEVIRQPDRRQHITARSFHSLTSSHYVSLNQPEQNEYGLDIIVTPAPNLAKLKVRGRPKMQPEDCGRSEDIHGIFGNVEQLTGPARKAQHVGEPQSVQPEIASIQGLGISASSLSARSRPETRSTNEFNSTKSKEGEEDNASLEPTAAQAFRLTATNLPMGKRKPSNHSDESFNSLNYPEDCEIEQALEGVVISTPSPVRLVISRSGSKRECRPPAESGT